MNSRRRGSPPQCAGNLARKNSLSIIVNTFAKLLLNPLFHIIWASWPRLLQYFYQTMLEFFFKFGRSYGLSLVNKIF